ncbi:MAG: hypothetical protein KatS3mg125_0171 [Lysobacterales bacterium]|jgi:SAM-dependent methyltransferase|nr:MAG: hypothetical protein KatS3mg125_0171 [Xanthomonadales bacterium]
MNGSDRRQAWNRYWASGALHSLAGSFRGNYEGAIRAFWLECFSNLSSADRVLDLGTGNGALPRLLLEWLPRERWPDIEAVDLAEPRPGWLAEYPDAPVRFRGGVRMEALPLADGTMSLITAQFALEYGEWPATAAECARVLAPGGRLAAVLHHADSHLSAVAKEELRHLEWLLGEAELEPVLLAALPYASGRSGPEESIARARLNEVLATLSKRIEEAEIPDGLLAAGRTALLAIETARRRGAEAGRACWSAFRAELEAAALRARELRMAALDELRMRRLQAMLARAGLAIERVGLLTEQDGKLLAWSLSGRRLQ